MPFNSRGDAKSSRDWPPARFGILRASRWPDDAPERPLVNDPRIEFEALAAPHMPALYRMARRLARQPEDAADVLQEALLRAFRTFRNFQRGTNAKAWLLTVLYSVFVNHYRRSRRDPEFIDPVDLEARFAALVDPPDEPATLTAVREAMAPEVEAALGALPVAFRTAVLLVDVEELTYEEAAATVGCPVGTLRSRLFRGRQALVVALAEYARRLGYPAADRQEGP